jgi:hypothetical protein
VTGHAKRAGGPIILPLVMVVIGVLLLLNNFLILPDFNIVNLLPLLLVVVGLQILLRGDVVPSEDARNFGITRGMVEAGILEVNAGEIDVLLTMLQPAERSRSPERLIAGQYASNARPDLKVTGVQAYLRLDRARTPWLSFADWELALAQEMPWNIAVSTSLGQVNADLARIVVEKALISTGVGDIRITTPREAFGALTLHSTLGSVHVVTPPGHQARITVTRSRFFGVQVDPNRYEEEAPGIYVARDGDEEATLVEIHVSGSTGDAYLA